MKLSSDLSDHEDLSVKVSAPLQALSKGDKQRFVEFKMKNEKSKMLTIADGTYSHLLFNLSYNLSLVIFQHIKKLREIFHVFLPCYLCFSSFYILLFFNHISFICQFIFLFVFDEK